MRLTHEYRERLTMAVRENDVPEPWVVVVFLLGQELIESRVGEVDDLFKTVNARWTTYQ